MRLLESGEMYLEAIYVLSTREPFVRAINVGEYLGFSKPSVSRALSLLKSDGYIRVGEDGGISFTERGAAYAKKIYERHVTISSLLIKLGVDEKLAVADACKMEHYISDETFEALKALAERGLEKT